MVGVKVAEEHGFQMGEVESGVGVGVGVGGRRPATAVDDEDSVVNDERRGDSRAAGCLDPNIITIRKPATMSTIIFGVDGEPGEIELPEAKRRPRC